MFPNSEDAAANAFRSTVVSNISSLTSSVESLKEEVQILKGKLDRDPTVVDDCSTCLIYVRLKHSTTESLTELLESKGTHRHMYISSVITTVKFLQDYPISFTCAEAAAGCGKKGVCILKLPYINT